MKIFQQYLNMDNKTLLEGIQQKPMVVKGDPLPMQSEHGWKATGDTLHDYVTWKQFLSNLSLSSDQRGRPVSSAQPQPSATNR